MNDFPVPNDARFEKLVAELALELVARGLKLATAESCTGGWIAKCCTDLAGSSAWFERGFVIYSDQAKTEMLAIPASLIEDYGAVSEAVATAMAPSIFPKTSCASFCTRFSLSRGPSPGRACA